MNVVPESPRLLLVEDDVRLAAMLAELFTAEGYDVVQANDGQRALHEGLTRQFEVLVLDRGLPAIEGLDVLTRLRSRGVRTPALVLSALGNPADRVEGLDRGAEDYLPKPFDIAELLARIRALVRRHDTTAVVLAVPGGAFDTQTRTVTTGTGLVALSEGEARLLERLARRSRQVFGRDDLLATVFPDATDPGVVDTYVHYLRRKLGRNAVHTVRGLGYRLGPVG
ncbi:response regulator transcription factor [Actinoplanes derwentensis]|uniref:DNA-binding response regulator, OmpR family, contains REC and winged-helix (WHTH) domain n=1 Tax=Actinoplanes derwentensis TaxID=113562 RepID=A0A1H2A7N3_9ACTN|nr:response regulator transcription factor [Actinoplanes derwentensis]GID88475.1 transcriptional regulator [Actinoplanes derwentensis]SDT41980.1 DNA-binding response regulator, OmpR family, contains REC and winged-helix (wHTH) domain [Actinoplanes derwentensis]